MIELTLPYPISANRYWATRIVTVKATYRSMAITYVTKEAEEFKAEVAKLCMCAGFRKPLLGRVAVEVDLYPQRPQDWAKRFRKDPICWDDDVRCIDLDNANKVLLDSLKGVAIEDDKWVREIHAKRMEPDGEARVVVRITQLALPAHPQGDLLGALA